MPPQVDQSASVTRWMHGIALVLIVLYALNVALAMLAVKGGVAIWRVGDVGEFMLVLTSMGFFVAGLVANEAGAGDEAQQAGHSNER